jgi:hypothetical protein
MTYLELCQMTTRQTGTIQGVLPTTVTGQVNRLKQIVEFVAEAYLDIQNAHRAWRWMQSYFTGAISLGDRFYQGTEFTDALTLAQIARFSQWGFKGDGSDLGLSIYPTSVGVAEEGPLRWLDWDYFYQTQLRGEQAAGRPQVFSVDNLNRLVISPAPDMAYTARGKYRKSAQLLINDIDVPEMPAEFHTIIKDAALEYMEGFDEGPRIPAIRLRRLPNWSMLEHHQLPHMTWGSPLA